MLQITADVPMSDIIGLTLNYTSHQPQKRKQLMLLLASGEYIVIEWYSKCLYATYSGPKSEQLAI